jgi:hypothetical protein
MARLVIPKRKEDEQGEILFNVFREALACAVTLNTATLVDNSIG